MVDNLANFINVGSCSAEIASNQAAGSYDLAGGAWSFNDAVTLYIGDLNIGEVRLGGSLSAGGKNFSLRQENGMLKLGIAVA